MDLKVGVIHTARELTLELGDDADREALTSKIESALRDDDSILWLEDAKGRKVGVPSEKLAYVEISGDSGRTVGFAR